MDPQYLIRVSHKHGRLSEIVIESPDIAQRVLATMHRNNPQGYGRLMHYGQCRHNSEITDLKLYWFLLPDLNWETIATYVNKELQAHG